MSASSHLVLLVPRCLLLIPPDPARPGVALPTSALPTTPGSSWEPTLGRGRRARREVGGGWRGYSRPPTRHPLGVEWGGAQRKVARSHHLPGGPPSSLLTRRALHLPPDHPNMSPTSSSASRNDALVRALYQRKLILDTFALENPSLANIVARDQKLVEIQGRSSQVAQGILASLVPVGRGARERGAGRELAAAMEGIGLLRDSPKLPRSSQLVPSRDSGRQPSQDFALLQR